MQVALLFYTMKIAIIDLGTNTFKLSFADIASRNFDIRHGGLFDVKLGKEGLAAGAISSAAFQRGLLAMEQIMEVIHREKATKTIAVATSAIRSSKNGKLLVDEIKKRWPIELEIVDGDKEAKLIYKGVKALVPFNHQPYLILDIGGGSNEFIIANQKKLLWKKSFNLGIARLLESFQPSDPILEHEIVKIERYLDDHLPELDEALKKYHPEILIGTSGTFETIRSLIHEGRKEDETSHSKKILLEDFYKTHQKLLKSSIKERLNMRGMEALRVEMIVLASIFVNFILKKYQIKSIIQSDYAIKEGLLLQYLNQ